jgi:DNA primase
MDVVALAQLGFPNAVATLGTACTPDHVQKLLRFTDSVVFSFDGDAAGRRAARKALDGALPLPPTCAASSFCFCRQSTTPTATCASMARMTPLPAMSASHAAEPLPDRSRQRKLRPGHAPRAAPTWPATPALVERCCPTACSSASCWASWPSCATGSQRPGGPVEPGGPRSSRRAPAGALCQRRFTVRCRRRRPTLVYDRPRPAEPDWQGQSDWKGAGWKKRDGAPWPPQPRLPRTPMASRADHAARLLLSHMGFWENLAHEDHAALCALPRRTAPCSRGWRRSCTSTAPCPGPCCAKACAATSARPWP